MKSLSKLILPFFIIIALSSCQSVYYQGNLYVPVKMSELKRDYKQIKEIDSFVTIKSTHLKTAELRDTVLKQNRIIVDKVNEINKTENKIKVPYDSKLYTLDEIKNGKLVRTYFNRDYNKKLIAYKKRKVTYSELILFGFYYFFAIGLITVLLIGLSLYVILSSFDLPDN